MDIIEKYKKEYAAWCRSLGISDISDVNRIVGEGKTRELIAVSEKRHSDKISQIAKNAAEGNKKIILISGPSSSGKTTFAKRLQLELKGYGISSVSVSLDDYYLSKADMPRGDDGEPDFEALEAIDYLRFNENIADLAAGKEAAMPAFDFVNARPVEHAHTLKLAENEVIIAEGIHGLNPKLLDTLSDDKKYRIYCSAISAINDKNGNRIKSATTRLIRRLIRDHYFRNSDYSVTFSLWPNQELGSKRYIFPYTDTADAVFNSSLPYEFSVYRPHLLSVLKAAGENDEYIDLIKPLRELALSVVTIDKSAAPDTSLLREFVGGSSL